MRNGQRPHRRRWLAWLSWLVVAALLGWVVARAPLAEAVRIVARLRVWQLAVLIALNAGVLLALNGRWWLILRAQGYAIPYLTLTGHRLAGFGVSYFTPGPQFGGEPVQVLLLERNHHVPRATAVATITVDKLLELLVNFMFLSGGALLIVRTQFFPEYSSWAAVGLAGGLLMVPVTLLLATAWGWYPVTRLLALGGRWSGWQRLSWRVRYDSAAAILRAGEVQATLFCRAAPGSLAAALLVSVVSWLLLWWEYGLMLRFLGLALTPAQIIIMLTAARLAFLLPLPAGLGSLEASQVVVIAALGFPPAAGISATLLIRARDVLLGLAGLGWMGWHWRKNRHYVPLQVDRSPEAD